MISQLNLMLVELNGVTTELLIQPNKMILRLGELKMSNCNITIYRETNFKIFVNAILIKLQFSNSC